MPPNLEPTEVIQQVAGLRALLCEWLGIQGPGPRTVFCVPHLTTEAWIVAALFQEGHEFGDLLESTRGLDNWLAGRPLNIRLKKSKTSYAGRAIEFIKGWSDAIRNCSQAEHFDRDVKDSLIHIFQ